MSVTCVNPATVSSPTAPPPFPLSDRRREVRHPRPRVGFPDPRFRARQDSPRRSRLAARAILHDALLVVVVTLIATAGCVQDPQPVASTLCHRTDAGVDRG